jgi:hypothetical protein
LYFCGPQLSLRLRGEMHSASPVGISFTALD